MRRSLGWIALAYGAGWAAVAPVQGQPFPAQNVTLKSWLPLSAFTPTPANGNDCWGYTSPSGREYALMGLSNQLAVVEVTQPDQARIVGSVPHTNSLWASVKVYRDYAYVSNEAGGGIDVVDLRNVDSGAVVLVRRVTQNGLARAHTVAVDTDSGFLYACGSNLNGGRLLALSLADPSNPVIAGQFTGPGSVYVHEAQVVTYTSGPYAGRQIAFCCNGGVGFDVVDVTNKSNMLLLARRTYPHLSYCHQGWLSEDRRYFYINDETDGVNETVIYDVSNIESPVFVGTYTAGLSATDHNQYVRGRLIFESDYRAGLQIFDATNPTAPVRVGYFDTYPENNNPGYAGSWSNYPFFRSTTVLISDMQRGLFVVDIAALVPCVGDLNRDRRVDQSDLGILLSCYGTGPCGDLDGDGDTDQADLGILLANWGNVCN